MKRKRNVCDGTIRLEDYRIYYWYDLQGTELTAELRNSLERTVKAKVIACIVGGYSYLGGVVNHSRCGELEIQGWWRFTT